MQIEKQKIIEEIIVGITQFKIIPFFGAGMSKGCGAKDWNELIDALRVELETSTVTPLDVAQEYEDRYGREKLVEMLQSRCRLSKTDSAALKNHLLIMGMNPPLIYTTNFDNALEEAAKLLNRRYVRIVTLKDILECPHGQEQVLKFHGDFSNPDSIIFTRMDYNRRLQTDVDPLDIRFRNDILGKGLLFLGYSFSDENIELIFQLHSQRYGQTLMPRSYLISFISNTEKERVLLEKNIVTLVLSGPEELAELIESISQAVFDRTFQHQWDQIFGEISTVAITVSDLRHLEDYVDNDAYTGKEKAEKINSVLSMKQLAADARTIYTNWVKKIVHGNDSFDIQEALIRSFQHIYGLSLADMISISFDLMELTNNQEFIRDFEGANWFTDVLSAIEHKLGDLLKETIEVRKIVCAIVLGFMEGMITEGKQLSKQQVERFLDVLKVQRYAELELGRGFTATSVKETIDHYLEQYPNLRSPFERQSFIKRHTLTELQEQMMRNFKR